VERSSPAAGEIFEPKRSLTSALFDDPSREGSVKARRKEVLDAKVSAAKKRWVDNSEADDAVAPFRAASSAPRATTSD
jgi:hypothetical protein